MAANAWLNVLRLLNDQHEMNTLQNVMDELLTSEEKEAIGLRLSIMHALITGEESQREIARRIGVSIAKVTRCSNFLKTLSTSELAVIEPTRSVSV